MSLKQELEALFGEDTVRMAMIQEILAQRYIQQNPAKVRENLQRFEKLKTFDKQKAFVASFTPEMSRAIICALLCNSASKVVADLGAHAVLDKRMGRAVLGGKIVSR